MSSNRVEEIKKEDKKAFKGFAIMMVISAMVGAVIGGGSIYLQENLGDNLSEFLLNALMMITPYASLVLSILVIIVSVAIYNRRKYRQYRRKIIICIIICISEFNIRILLLWGRNGIAIRRLICKSNFIFSWIYSMCSINYINPK